MRRVVLALALGLLSACNSQEAEQPKGSSFGQVLPGSISDAMLPYDTASSAPPLEPRDYATESPSGRSTRATVPDEDVVPEPEAS